MNIAEKYFKNQLSSDEFRRSFLEEKVKLDIEYKLEELKKDILSRVQDFIIARVINKLSDEQVNEMNALLDTDPSDEQIMSFVSKSLNNSDKFISDTLFQFRQTYLGMI